MNIHREADGSLVVREGWAVLRFACLAGGLILPSVLVWVELSGNSASYLRLAGGAAGSILLLLIGAVVDDRRFEFDATRRLLTWEQKNWFRTRRGRLEFSQIKDVLVTSTRNRDDGAYTVDYSTVLITGAGRLLLSAANGSRTECQHLAEIVLSTLARPDARPKDEAANPLIEGGNMIDAVAAIREDEGLDLTEARDRAKCIDDDQIESRPR